MNSSTILSQYDNIIFIKITDTNSTATAPYWDESPTRVEVDFGFNYSDALIKQAIEFEFEQPHRSRENVIRCQWVLRKKYYEFPVMIDVKFRPKPKNRRLRCNRKGIGLRIKTIN